MHKFNMLLAICEANLTKIQVYSEWTLRTICCLSTRESYYRKQSLVSNEIVNLEYKALCEFR